MDRLEISHDLPDFHRELSVAMEALMYEEIFNREKRTTRATLRIAKIGLILRQFPDEAII